jgi:hypothetical protein
MAPKTMVSNEVYLLPLNDDGSPQVAGEYIYLAPKCNDPVIIRFAIEGTSSICRHGSLWVNIPEQGAEFRRDKFREFKYVALVGMAQSVGSSANVSVIGSYRTSIARLRYPSQFTKRALTLSTPPMPSCPIYRTS